MPASKPKPPDSCRVLLGITKDGKETFYIVSVLDPCPTIFWRAWKLRKGGAENDPEAPSEYHVGVTGAGAYQCDCAGFIYHKDKPCKHCLTLKALRGIGLMG